MNLLDLVSVEARLDVDHVLQVELRDALDDLTYARIRRRLSTPRNIRLIHVDEDVPNLQRHGLVSRRVRRLPSLQLLQIESFFHNAIIVDNVNCILLEVYDFVAEVHGVALALLVVQDQALQVIQEYPSIFDLIIVVIEKGFLRWWPRRRPRQLKLAVLQRLFDSGLLAIQKGPLQFLLGFRLH